MKIKRNDLKIIAMEVCRENLILLRVNCILIDAADIIAEHFALPDQIGIDMLRFEEGNTGGTHFVGTCEASEKVNMIKLDGYVHNTNIVVQILPISGWTWKGGSQSN